MIELKVNIDFGQLMKLANQLPSSEKQQLIDALQKSIVKGKSGKGERSVGKYNGKINMTDDFNAPLDDFKEYM